MATMDDAQVKVRVRTGPRVAVAVLLRDDAGRVLWEQRKGGVGAGSWSIPGGGVEDGEDPVDTARREIREETGAEIFDVQPHPAWQFVRIEDGTTWICLFFTARLDPSSPKPRILEPRKCADLSWRYSDDMPAGPHFGAVERFLAAGNDPWGGYPR